MTTSAPSAASRRPTTVIALVSVLALLGLAAFGGGVEMLVNRHGGTYVPARWLDEIPLIDSYVLPGLVLGLVFGVGSVVTAVGMVRRSAPGPLRGLERRTGYHWSWGVTLTLGAAFALWLMVEIALLGGPFSQEKTADQLTAVATYVVFFSADALLLALPRTERARRHLAIGSRG